MKTILLSFLLSFSSFAQDVSSVTGGEKVTIQKYNSLVTQINKIRNLEVLSETQESLADYGTSFTILTGNVVTAPFENQGSGLYSMSSGVITILKDNVTISIVSALRLHQANNTYITVKKSGEGSFDLKTYTTEASANYGDTLYYKETLNTGDQLKLITDGSYFHSSQGSTSSFYLINAVRKAKIGELID